MFLTLIILFLLASAWNSDSEAFTNRAAPPPNDALQETKSAQGQVRNRLECQSPNRKRPRSNCLAKSGQMGARTNQRGKAVGAANFGSMEEDGSCDENDATPSLRTRIALAGSCSDQEVVQEEATPGAILFGWKRVKLEPDC
jgi:hypothetical protein